MDKYICKVRYERTMEDGSLKRVTESVLVKAASNGEAEKAALEEYGYLSQGEVEIRSITVSNFAEIITSDDDNAKERYYRAKLRFVTLDERTGKEKYTSQNIIVQADDLSKAISTIDEYMKTSITDYSVTSVSETNIQGIISYKEKNEE